MNVQNRGGGIRAVFTMCKKTSDLAEDGFPYNLIIVQWLISLQTASLLTI